MRIQLYISGHAPEGDRLRAVLQDNMPGVPVVFSNNIDDLGREVQTAYNDKNIAVIMVAGPEELAELARLGSVWDRFWTILVLPGSEPEIISMGHALRPRFVTFTDGDFSDVSEVLNHIRDSADGDVSN